MRRFHVWYDQLPQGTRFAVFMLGIALPFILLTNLAMFVLRISPLGLVGFSLFFTAIAGLAISRVRYIHEGKKN